MNLDLFKLHSKTDTPHGWIWVKLNSNLLRKEYINFLKKENQKSIVIKISNKLNSGVSTVEKHLIRLKNSKKDLELPLPIIIEITNLISIQNLKIKLIKDIKYFICKNSTIKQKIKAIKTINKNFAKLIGAFIADGHSKPEGNTYRLRISEGKEDLIKISTKWIKEIFRLNAIIRFNKKDNTYNCWFNNKIIGRYLKNIFKIPSGKKAYIVKEPEIIKNSSKEIRKAFALGVFSFDGGVDSAGIIGLTSKSKNLINDLYEILKLDKINVNKRTYKNHTWIIESKSGRNKEYLKKWLDYFESGTWKHKRLKFFIKNKSNNSIKKLNHLFPKHYHSKINLNEVYNSIKTIKTGKIKDILKELNKKTNISLTTIYKYLHILEKSNLISKTPEKVNDGKNYWSETIYNINGRKNE